MKKSIEFTTLSWETLLALSTTILAAGFIVTGDSQQTAPRCDPQTDVFFLEDQANLQAFFKCKRSTENPWFGQWERHYCPNDMYFVFGTQQCKMNELPPNTVREANDLFQIAILNGSCANNEICLGGTVCDPTKLLCLCPYGKMANLETLSCVEVKMPPSGGYTAQEAVVRPVVEQQTYPTAYGNLQYPSQNVGGGIQQQYSTTASAPAIYSFLPLSTLSAAPNNNNILPPNTSPNTYYYQQLKKVFQELSQNPHQQVKKLLAGLYSIGNNLTSSTSTAAVDGQQQQQQYVSASATPGMSCGRGERCTGGSICVPEVGLCLCPGSLENHRGQCTSSGQNPSQQQQQHTKSPALLFATVWNKNNGNKATTTTLQPCQTAAQQLVSPCSYGTNCVNGLCQPQQWTTTVTPAPPSAATVAEQQTTPQQQRQYTLFRVPKGRRESGPGELCNDGQNCVRGSVCNRQIPICVCPPGTDLLSGWCLPVSPVEPMFRGGGPNSVVDEMLAWPNNYQRTVASSAAGSESDERRGPQEKPPAGGNAFGGRYRQTMVPINSQEQPDSGSGGPLEESPFGGKKRFGGQAGIGSRCSLNTNCLPGAYCNGNTQPPSCQCLSTHVNVDGRCDKVIYPGQTGCENDLQCSTGYAGTKCINRQCLCPPGAKAIDQMCISAIAWPGERCNITQFIPVCSSPLNSYCFEGRCVCTPPLTLFQKQCVLRTEIIPTEVEEDPFAEEMGGFPPPPFQFEEATSSSIAGESSSKKEILDGPSKKVLDASAAGNNNNNFCASNDDCPQTFLCLENVCECPPEKVRLGDKCVDDDRADYYPEEGFADDGLLLEETENFGKEGGKEEQKMSPIEQMFATLALFKEIGKKDNKDDAEEASDGRIPPIGKKGSENIGGDDSEIATRRTNLPTIKNSSTTQPPPNGVVEKGVVKVDSLIDLPKKMSKKEKSLLAEEELMRQRRETTRVRSSNPAVAPDFGIRLSGEPCKPGDVCLHGTSCSDGVCKCPKGFKFENNTCTKPPTVPGVPLYIPIGAKCTDHDRCSGGSLCLNLTCSCVGSSLSLKGRCVQKPGGKCSQGESCSGGSRCQLGTCKCPSGRRLHNNAFCVVSVAEPGQSCQSGERCSNGSVCRFGVCMCPTDHHVVERRCKPLQNQHSPMKNPAEHRNSREKHSGLPPEKIPQHTSLISSSSKSPTTVTSSQKVLVNGSTSLASLGLLTPDQQKWLFSDKPPSSPTSSSSISSTADHHHGSSTGHHPHQVGHIYGGGAPHISTFAPAGHHQNTADSSIIHNNSASSHLSTRGGSVFPPGGIKMMSPGLLGKEEILLSATAGPGDSCANGACIGGSVCRHGICVCAPGEVIVGRRCVDSDGQALQAPERMNTADPGQPCIHGVTCTGGSVCRGNICLCPEDTSLFRGDCLGKASHSSLKSFWRHAPLFNPNTLTMRDDGDATNNAMMRNLVDDPVPSKTVSPGAMCRISLECPYRTECIRGVCRCQKGETIVNGICRKSIYQVLPGGRCDTQRGLDCIGESHCFYGICVCLYGLVNTGTECVSADILKTAAPGESCALGQQCEGRSKCVSGICQCVENEQFDTNSKRCITQTPSSVAAASSFHGGNQATEEDDDDSSAQATSSSSHHRSELVGIHLGSSNGTRLPHVQIYSSPHKKSSSSSSSSANDDGRFNQILTANQMSINVLDQDTLKALLGTRLLTHLPGLGERCDSSSSTGKHRSSATTTSTSALCSGGARCVRAMCVCPDGHAAYNGHCVFNPIKKQRQRVSSAPPPPPPEERDVDRSSRPSPAISLQQYITRMNNNNNNNGAENIMGNQKPPFRFDLLLHSHQQNAGGRQNQHHLLDRIGSPGYECGPNQECQGGAICINNLCVCRPGYRPQNGYCQIAKVNLGHECFFNEQCTNDGFCVDGFCRCSSEDFGPRSSSSRYVSFYHRRRCPRRPMAQAGEDCSAQQACGFNSICGTYSTVCECSHGMESVRGVCMVARHPHGSDCFSSTQCSRYNYCDNGFCVCKASHLAAAGNLCLPPAKPLIDDPTALLEPESVAHYWGNNGKGSKVKFVGNGGNNVVDLLPEDDGLVEEEDEEENGGGGQHRRRFGRTGNEILQKQVQIQRPFPSRPFGGGGKNHPHNSMLENDRRSSWFEMQPPPRTQQQQQSPSFDGRQMINDGHPPRLWPPAEGEDEFVQPRRRFSRFHPTVQQQPQFEDYSEYVAAGIKDYGGSGSSRFPVNRFHGFPTTSAGFNNPLEGFNPIQANGVQNVDLNRIVVSDSDPENEEQQQWQEEQQPKKQTMAMPGEYCNRDRICIGNSLCASGWCQCGDGIRVEKSGICAYHGAGGTNTKKAAAAAVQHSPPKRIQQQQIGGTDQAAATTTPRKPNESCGMSPGLCVDGAYCVKSTSLESVQRLGPFCQCVPKRVNINGVCVPRKSTDEHQKLVQVGQRCSGEDICDSGARCGADGICVCQNDTEFTQGICAQFAKPGESCSNGEFCTEGAVCISSIHTCVCPVGMLVRGGKCESEKATTSAAPQTSMAHHPPEHRHPRTRNSGSPPALSSWPPPSFHRGGSSSRSTFHGKKRVAPLPPPQIMWPPPHGGPYGPHSPFPFPNNPMIPHPAAPEAPPPPTTAKFVIKAVLGQQCTSSDDCAVGECSDSGICACPEGTQEVYTQCISSRMIRKPGQQCQISEHICSGQSWCKDGYCRCLDRKIMDGDRCVSPRRYLMERLAFLRHHHHRARKPVRTQQQLPFNPHLLPPPSRTVVGGGGGSLPLSRNALRPLLQQQKKFVPIICGVDLDCPMGARCSPAKCQCNTLTIVTEQDFSARSGGPKPHDWRNGRCHRDEDCPGPLNCREGKCVCLSMVELVASRSKIMEAKKKGSKKSSNNGGAVQAATNGGIQKKPPPPSNTGQQEEIVGENRPQNYQPPRKRLTTTTAAAHQNLGPGNLLWTEPMAAASTGAGYIDDGGGSDDNNNREQQQPKQRYDDYTAETVDSEIDVDGEPVDSGLHHYRRRSPGHGGFSENYYYLGGNGLQQQQASSSAAPQDHYDEEEEQHLFGGFENKSAGIPSPPLIHPNKKYDFDSKDSDISSSSSSVGLDDGREHRPRSRFRPMPEEVEEEQIAGALLPGALCDAFSQCGAGAECHFGRCQCLDADHRLVFVNGTTLCVETNGGEHHHTAGSLVRRRLPPQQQPQGFDQQKIVEEEEEVGRRIPEGEEEEEEEFLEELQQQLQQEHKQQKKKADDDDESVAVASESPEQLDHPMMLRRWHPRSFAIVPGRFGGGGSSGSVKPANDFFRQRLTFDMTTTADQKQQRPRRKQQKPPPSPPPPSIVVAKRQAPALAVGRRNNNSTAGIRRKR